QGWQNKDIAAEVDLDRRQVALWRQRFLEGGVEALRHDAPRPGRTPSVTTAEFESSIVDKTLHDRPIAATHWSTRTLAAQLGVGPTTIRRVWQRNGLKPHRQSSFKLSRDPRFEDKLLDVVGLYLNPPERALVLSCDEKSHPLTSVSIGASKVLRMSPPIPDHVPSRACVPNLRIRHALGSRTMATP
ncbi:MAG: IS630 family transposase, partial [Variovorax sp.]